MDGEIGIWGIETNNLKNIDIALKNNGINLIVGPSGSGKSSLAYDTIAQIGQHEYMSMFADNVSEPSYRIKKHENMTVTVPIKQLNHNSNMRSTIGTYFGLNSNIAMIYSICLNLAPNLFVLNRTENVCPHCHGLGIERQLDPNKFINYDSPLEQNPFRCWTRYKDFYCQIIRMFCQSKDIDAKKTFRQLTAQEKNELLYGESMDKFSVRYKKTSAFSRRTTKYYGIMTEKPMMLNFTPSEKFFSNVTCSCCGGNKYSHERNQQKLDGMGIADFMSTPFSELETFVEKLISKNKKNELSFILDRVKSFLSQANRLHLGHLYLHRAIPTLSGGELQRLKMVQVLSSRLNNLILVFDEPLAGLSGAEKKAVYSCISELSQKHSTVIVDHSDVFVNVAATVTALGAKSGADGGFIIDACEYMKEQRKKTFFRVIPYTRETQVKISFPVYCFKGVDITIAKDCLNLITGGSGIGKSTLLREYLPQFFERYIYISQKPLLGNTNSNVATTLNISQRIFDQFGRAHNKDARFFSNQTGSQGACPVCRGAGYIEYENGSGHHVQLICKECAGSGFNKNLLHYLLKGKNILDVWNMSIDEAVDFFCDMDDKLVSLLETPTKLLLGHLHIGQPISTLSGGENIRIRLVKSVKASAKTLGIDEPFKGLNNSEIYSIVSYLDYLREKGKTILVVDHTEGIERYFAKHIELKLKNEIITSS